MSNDRGQERDEEQDSAPRPVTAAARRGRRVADSRSRQARTATDEGAATETPVKSASAQAGTTARSDGKPEGKAATKSASKAGSGSRKTQIAESDRATTPKKGKPTPTRGGTQKQPPLPSRIARFLREVVDQLRKVIWPTRKQMITYFSVVFVFLVVLVAFVFGLDLGFSKLMFVIFG